MASYGALLRDYLNGLQTNIKPGNATEHTHRPVLKALLESFGDHVTATNEPKRIECGAPDFIGNYILKFTRFLGHTNTKPTSGCGVPKWAVGTAC